MQRQAMVDIYSVPSLRSQCRIHSVRDLKWLAAVSAPPTSAGVADQDYDTDCISIFNGKRQNIQHCFW